MTLAMIWGLIGDYTIAAALGAVVSSGEIVARYRDEPWDTLRSLPAIFLHADQRPASMAALTVVRTFNINFGANETNTPLIQVIVAGLGAMMVFRSAFFTMRVGDQDVAVGAISFLQVMLDAVNREVDRRRAILRADRVRRIMDGIAFEKALTALPTYSIALMQNMEDDDQKKLLDDLNKLSAFPDFDGTVKTQILGLAVMNYLGEDVLQASVDALRARINLSQLPSQPVIEAPTTGLSLDRMLDRIRSEGTAGKTPSEVLPKDSPAGPVPAGEAAPGAASQAASAGAGVGTLSGTNGSEKPTTPVDEPAVAPALVPTSLPETSLDITRVLHRVREKTSAPDAPATAPEKTPIPQADSLPVETTTTVSLPVNG